MSQLEADFDRTAGTLMPRASQYVPRGFPEGDEEENGEDWGRGYD